MVGLGCLYYIQKPVTPAFIFEFSAKLLVFTVHACSLHLITLDSWRTGEVQSQHGAFRNSDFLATIQNMGNNS